MKLVIGLAVLAIPGIALGQPSSTQYNPLENRWEIAPQDSTPQYNAFENEWQMAPDGASPVYDAFENTWEMPRFESAPEPAPRRRVRREAVAIALPEGNVGAGLRSWC